MLKTSFLAFVFLALGASTAFADPDSRWYVGGAIGANWLKDYSIDRTTLFNGAPGLSTKLYVDTQNDAAYFGVLGYRFTDAWSIQGELAYRSNKSDSVTTPFGVLSGNDTRVKSASLMANAIYTVQGLGALRPYAGLGVGAVNVKLEKNDGLGSTDDSDWAFAYQGLVGAEVNLSRQWSLYGQYQYLKASNLDLTATTSRGAFAQQYSLDSYTSQSLSVGVRYSF
jgi:opacity protein-like surface antigen